MRDLHTAQCQMIVTYTSRVENCFDIWWAFKLMVSDCFWSEDLIKHHYSKLVPVRPLFYIQPPCLLLPQTCCIFHFAAFLCLRTAFERGFISCCASASIHSNNDIFTLMYSTICSILKNGLASSGRQDRTTFLYYLKTEITAQSSDSCCRKTFIVLVIQ